jgi:hypothetical protein
MTDLPSLKSKLATCPCSARQHVWDFQVEDVGIAHAKHWNESAEKMTEGFEKAGADRYVVYMVARDAIMRAFGLTMEDLK